MKHKITDVIEYLLQIREGECSLVDEIIFKEESEHMRELLTGILFLYEDWTLQNVNQIQIQKKITEGKSYVDNILKSMIDALISLTPEGLIQGVNQATTDLLGYKEEELIGQPFSTIIAEEEEEEEFMGTRLEYLVKEGSLRNFNIDYKTKTGHRIPMSFSGSVMRDKEGKLVGIVGVAKDMRGYNMLMEASKRAADAASAAAQTEREKSVELEKANVMLKQTQDQLVQAGKLTGIGQFVAGIAHELNNPLGGCVGLIQLILVETEKEDKQFKKLKSVERELLRSTGLVRDLLSFSRPEKEKAKFTEVNCNEIIDKAFSLVEHEFKKREIVVQKNFDSQLPRIVGGEQRLQQVFLNFISNALDAIDSNRASQKGVSGTLKIQTHKKGGGIEVVFEDTGCGIEKKNIEKLFEPFYTSKEPGKGTGLGLSVSYSIIQTHGGDITVDSKVGKGTSFKIYLPVNTNRIAA